MMTSKERVIRAIQFQKPNCPADFACNTSIGTVPVRRETVGDHQFVP